ncbi:hypothetical protein [Microseira sp. BLCC-F43]|jgi:hypothetical protein|uniref:hypothetical protein n=1 Tax=Microseira sp. BLCC-F43 TaxID=3153602 RepID=UPI0035B890E9
MTPSEAKDIIRRASKYRADAESVLEDLEHLYLAAFQGYLDERNTARGDVVTLTARDMKAALDAKKAMWQVVMDLHKVSKDDAETAVQDFIINVLPLPEPALELPGGNQ